MWHQAHFPLPKHLGNQTVLLLAEHHAVQGVLQSEELQEPCVYGWEAEHLTGHLLERFKFWEAEKCRKGAQTQIEQKIGIYGWTPEQKREHMVKARASQDPDACRERMRIVGKSGAGGAVSGKKNGKVQGKKNVKSGLLERVGNEKWMSTVDFYCSTAAGVSLHNHYKGWDRKAKIKVSTLEAPIHTFGPNI